MSAPLKLKPREFLIALWADGAFTVEAEDAKCWHMAAPPAMIRAVAAIPVESALADAEARIAELTAEAERLRVQLAGCSVAALGNTPEAVAQRAKPEDWGWSASYADVCAAVDREMAHRARVAELEAALRRHGRCAEFGTSAPNGTCRCEVCAALDPLLAPAREKGENDAEA